MLTSSFEFLLALTLMAVMPFVGSWKYRRLTIAIQKGVPNARLNAFLQTIIMQWSLMGLLFAIWTSATRPWWELGWQWQATTGFTIGGGICLLLAAIFVLQGCYVRRRPDVLMSLRHSAESLSMLAPRNTREMTAFLLLAVTAGICEETLYRGFLYSYLSSWFGAIPAFFLGSLCFGIGHAYQGISGVLKTAVVGAVTTALYLGMESLYGVAVLHAAIDISSGLTLRKLFSILPSEEVASP